jgi:hypothetical protein
MNTTTTIIGSSKALWIRLTQVTGLEDLTVRCEVCDLHSVLIVAGTDSDVFGVEGTVDLRSVALRVPQDDLFGIGRPSIRIDRHDLGQTLHSLTEQAQIQTEKDRRAGWTIDRPAQVWVTFSVLAGADRGLHLTIEKVERSHAKVS